MKTFETRLTVFASNCNCLDHVREATWHIRLDAKHERTVSSIYFTTFSEIEVIFQLKIKK